VPRHEVADAGCRPGEAFFFEPDLQYIIRSGGTGNIPNAFVVGAQTGLNF
jgi:carbohydrate-selective porin OprB